MRMGVKVLWAGLSLSILGMLGAAADASAQVVGEQATGNLLVAGKQVPLPPGTFTVISVDTAPARVQEVETLVERLDLGPIQTVVLASAAEGRVNSVVEISANLIPHHDGWGTTADCTRTDLYAAVTNYKSGWDVSCLYLKPIAVDGREGMPGGSPLIAYAKLQEAEASDFWITAGLRVANRQDVLDVRYHFDPAMFGASASAATADTWSPAVIERNTARLIVVKDIAAWASAMVVALDQGLRGRLAPDQVALPISGSSSAVEGSGAEAASVANAVRAKELLALRESGELSQDEYQRQMALVSSGAAAAAAAGGWTYAQVAGWKAATYRVMVTAVNVGIDYMFIGRPFAAGVLVILQVVVNTTKFFFHEMLWQDVFGVGPLQRENPRVIELGPQLVTAATQ
ncbi:MAG: DUF2061 domain-containing protein [Alphaproteobacteria bacterium]|nr:DUF2061 domain-containing protein [Alphaproteobacteria bacterium]